jgi:hypothetical protein
MAGPAAVPPATVAAATATPAPPAAPPAATPTPADDLAALSDEFDNAASLVDWKNLATVEGFPNQVESGDVNTTKPGQLYMVPYVSGWYGDYRGIFLYKEVTGDFDVTTRITATGKNSPIPRHIFSLAGVRARTPRAITMQTWTKGGENWVFVNTGYGDNEPGRKGKAQMETKTTVNSDSTLELVAIPTGPVDIRMVRVGPAFVMLYRAPGQDWTVSERFLRADMPATLQVGMDAYTNWDEVDGTAAEFNSKLLTHPAQPADLLIANDYMRFHRPQVSAAVRAKLADPLTLNDELLKLLP